METDITTLEERFSALPVHKQKHVFCMIRKIIGDTILKRIDELTQLSDGENQDFKNDLDRYQALLHNIYLDIMYEELIKYSDNFGFLLDSTDRVENYFKQDEANREKTFRELIDEECSTLEEAIKECLDALDHDYIVDTPFDLLALYPVLSSSIIQQNTKVS